MSSFRPVAGFLLLLFACGSVQAEPARVENIRLAVRDTTTRVVLDLDRPVEHSIFSLTAPDRVVVDIPHGRIDHAARSVPAGQGAVRRIRTANRRDGSVRIVLDLQRPVKPRSFLLARTGGRHDRLVIDLQPERGAGPVKKIDTEGTRDIVVVVDPGHGGKDPGSHGPSGLKEKDAVLGIARRLAERINREPGMRAVMTRSTDRFVLLRNRMEKARSLEADLFISIHADSFRDRRVNGATVYVLSDKGASDEAARRLAARENAAALIGGVSLDDKDDVLASVLLDLSQNASLSSSIAVGDEILANMARVGRLRKPTVQQAPFLVLKSPDVPSVLIETAFISNRNDERNLGSRSYQDKLARAILAGVKKFFYASPPRGTLVAQLSRRNARQRTMAHRVRRGDTLSEIASQYHVSIGRIRAANRLRGDKIVVGKVLTIPVSQGI